jgi:hypothetical protein
MRFWAAAKISSDFDVFNGAVLTKALSSQLSNQTLGSHWASGSAASIHSQTDAARGVPQWHNLSDKGRIAPKKSDTRDRCLILTLTIILSIV